MSKYTKISKACEKISEFMKKNNISGTIDLSIEDEEFTIDIKIKKINSVSFVYHGYVGREIGSYAYLFVSGDRKKGISEEDLNYLLEEILEFKK